MESRRLRGMEHKAPPIMSIGIPKPRPRLLRKREAKATQARQWAELRRRVLRRDGGKCRVCRFAKAFEAHHVVFRSLGGKDVARNLISVCRECHRDIHGHVVRLRWSDSENPEKTLRVERVA